MASGRRAALVERSRQAAGDLSFLGAKYVGFGDGRTSPALVNFLELMIRATPVSVVAEFFGALRDHDKEAVQGILGQVPVVVLAGERDRLVPAALTDRLGSQIPGARHIRLPGAGHMVILERPAEVNEAIAGLVSEAAERPGERAVTRRQASR